MASCAAFGFEVVMVPAFYTHASLPGITSWGIPLLVGFLTVL